MTSVGFVLNLWKRPDNLTRQIEAVKSQTVPPAEVVLWVNGVDLPGGVDFSQCTVAQSSQNFGVWARFAYALNLRTDFICVVDDDTFPGNRWVENCLKTMKTHEGLLGTRGLRFKSTRSYHPAEDFGWGRPNQFIEKVDIVGHNWFFRREWLSEFWSEMPPKTHDVLVGEDIHFSYALQKRLGIGTYVPPHPEEDTSLWGSVPDFEKLALEDPVSISGRDTAMDEFRKVYLSYIDLGFKIIGESSDATVLGSGLTENSKIRKAFRKFPFLHRRLKALVFFLEKRGIYL